MKQTASEPLRMKLLFHLASTLACLAMLGLCLLLLKVTGFFAS